MVYGILGSLKKDVFGQADRFVCACSLRVILDNKYISEGSGGIYFIFNRLFYSSMTETVLCIYE